MGTHRWQDIKAKRYANAPERLAAIEEQVAEDILEMNLREAAEGLGKTQAEMADAIGQSQAELSKTERRDDHLVSTLRRYVEAMGGELEVVARFGDKQVRLKGV